MTSRKGGWASIRAMVSPVPWHRQRPGPADWTGPAAPPTPALPTGGRGAHRTAGNIAGIATAASPTLLRSRGGGADGAALRSPLPKGEGSGVRVRAQSARRWQLRNGRLRRWFTPRWRVMPLPRAPAPCPTPSARRRRGWRGQPRPCRQCHRRCHDRARCARTADPASHSPLRQNPAS